tara:strand:+ start:612 stop:1016 length:405 start_codon:yes stop_codon:yes gene_type:complete
MSNTGKISLAEFKNTDSKIRKIKRLDELQTFKVFPRSSLRLHVLGNMSTFYIDHYVNGNQKRVPLGSWKDPDTNNGGELTVDEVIELGAELKKWCKANKGTPNLYACSYRCFKSTRIDCSKALEFNFFFATFAS